MTLDGVPSPLASRTDQEMEPEDELNMTSELLENDRPKPAVHLRLGTDLVKADSKRNIYVSTYRRVTCDGNLTKKEIRFLLTFILSPSCFCADGDIEEVEDMDVSPDQTKQQKLLERCKFWPTCKSGDECLYHHPNKPCT